MFRLKEHGHYSMSSDEDLIFLGKASIGIKNDLQKKKMIFYVEKNTLKVFNTYKNYIGKSVKYLDLINKI